MLDHIKTAKAGSSSYYAERQRGTVDVWHDSSRYIYRKPWRGLRKFKGELRAVFGDRGQNVRIEGAYPSYTITTFC